MLLTYNKFTLNKEKTEYTITGSLCNMNVTIGNHSINRGQARFGCSN